MPNDPPRFPPRLPLAPKRPKTELDAMLETFLESRPAEEQKREDADRRRDELWAKMIANVMARFAKVEDEAGKSNEEHRTNHKIAMMAIHGLSMDFGTMKVDVAQLKNRPAYGPTAPNRPPQPSAPTFNAIESLGVQHDTGSFELHDGTIIQRDTYMAWKQQSVVDAQKIADKAIRDRETDLAAEKWRAQQKNKEKVLWGVVALVVTAVVVTLGVVLIKQAARDIERGEHVPATSAAHVAP